MHEAFEAAARQLDKKDRSNAQLQKVVLREEYRALGDRFFRDSILGFPLYGRKVEIRSGQHLLTECHRLHTQMVEWPVDTRSNLLSGLTYGMRIEEGRIHIAHRGLLEEEDDRVYTPSARLFQVYLIVLYGFDDKKRDDFFHSVNRYFDRQISGNATVALPEVRSAAGVILGKIAV